MHKPPMILTRQMCCHPHVVYIVGMFVSRFLRNVNIGLQSTTRRQDFKLVRPVLPGSDLFTWDQTCLPGRIRRIASSEPRPRSAPTRAKTYFKTGTGIKIGNDALRVALVAGKDRCAFLSHGNLSEQLARWSRQQAVQSGLESRPPRPL